MIVVGLTGGIGSGKTSVLQLFIDKGIAVYIADIQAKKIMQTNVELIKKIKDVFGEKTYTKDNKLNRSYLAKQVFRNSEKLSQLNALVHPAVHQQFLKFKTTQKGPFLIYENAILFENGSDSFCDYIITVTAPIDTRITRVVKRDNITQQEVLDRMNHQWDDQLKIKRSDFVVENINWKTTKKIVDDLHLKLIDLSEAHNKK